MKRQIVNRLKCVSIKSNHLWTEIDRKAELLNAPQQSLPPRAMNEQADSAFENRGKPTRAEMIAIQMCKTDRPDIERRSPSPIHPLRRRPRPDAGIDEHRANRRAHERAVARRPTCENAQFDGHPFPECAVNLSSIFLRLKSVSEFVGNFEFSC